MIITSLTNDKVKYYHKVMNNKKVRDNDQVYVVEGEHLVYEAIKENRAIEILILENKHYDHLIGNTIYVSKEVMNKICDTKTPQGIIALCKQVELPIESYDRLLLLDGVSDPGNLGTIIRSADAFNFDGVILSHDTVDLFNPKVIRATQGSLFRVKTIRRDLEPFIKELKEKQVLIYGTSLEGRQMRHIEATNHMAFIMGNEGQGVSQPLLNQTDENLLIEMNGDSESLNVAIAASIVMYNFQK